MAVAENAHNPTSDTFRDEKQVLAITRLSQATRYRLRLIGKFPEPYRISKQKKVWSASEIDEWIEEQKSKGQKTNPSPTLTKPKHATA